jgi:hypothetical protein
MGGKVGVRPRGGDDGSASMATLSSPGEIRCWRR